MVIKIDVNYEKWIGKTSRISNATLDGWAHYIKRTREKLIPFLKSEDAEIWERHLQNVEQEILDSRTRPRPKPKIIEFGESDD
jgi:hypothetical protein